MPRNLWSGVPLVAVVVVLSGWSLYPPKRTINLGLDLQGGTHLVLGVEADKYVASQTDRAAEDLKATLERKGVAVKRIAREGDARSEEHTSELQSRPHLVCRLLLEKKKKFRRTASTNC